MTTAGALAICCVLLFGPVPTLLSRANWPTRAPRAAVLLWQMTGLAGCLAAIGSGLALAVLPLHTNVLIGITRLTSETLGHRVAALNFYEAFGLALATFVTGTVTGGLVVTMVRTLRTRSRHRRVLDVVGTPSDQLQGALLLDHPEVVAYCVPGVRARIVLSIGALQALDPSELAAVIAHERGHAHARHDLVMLPLAALIGPLRWVPYARLAPRAVSSLLEMAADDFACRTHDRRVVAGALVHMVAAGAGQVPACAFGSVDSTVSTRVHRLLTSEQNSLAVGAAAIAGACTVLAIPFVATLTPLLTR
jgi:Zn-dependent protease with chaperone function